MYSIKKTTLLIFCFSVSIYAQKITISKDNMHKIDRIFKRFNNDNTPGVAVAFMKNDSLFFKSYGMSSLEHNIKIDSSSVFNLASVSKQFTAFAILLLEYEGKLKLTDDIRNYLPQLPDYGKTITIENLLNHTSGLRSCLQLLGLKGYTTDNIITTKDIEQVIYKQLDLNFNPKDEFSYSNSGYFLLAKIIENVTKQSFSEFLKIKVFKPLQMNASFVMDDFHRIVKNRANSYEINNESYVNAPANYSYTGTTGVYSTVLDMIKWVRNFKTQNVGNETIFNKMNTLSALNSGEQLNYANGQFFENYRGIQQVYHSGADAGYRTYLGRFPELNSSIIILSNNNTINVRQKALEVLDVLIGNYYKKTESKPLVKKQFKSTIEIKKYEGSYISNKTHIIREVFVKNDTLWYARPEQGGRKTNLKPFSSNRFQLGDFNDIDITFIDNSLQVYVDNNLVENYTKFLPKKYNNTELKQFLGHFYCKELDETYTLVSKENKIMITHPKMDNIELTPVFKDSFLSSNWRFQFLEFTRNKKGIITGFQISSERIRNINFIKVQ